MKSNLAREHCRTAIAKYTKSPVFMRVSGYKVASFVARFFQRHRVFDIFNKHTGFCWVVPITTPQKGLPNEINLPENLPVHGILLLSQLRSIDWRARSFSAVCFVPTSFLKNILDRLAIQCWK